MKTRRARFRINKGLLLLLCLVLSKAWAGTEAPSGIVVIIADDVGMGDLGAYGGRVISTPHIDSLAREGTLLTHAYAGASMCGPSRAAQLTGQYPVQLGLAAQLTEVHPGLRLPAATKTIASALRPAGYRSAYIGEWHFGLEPEEQPTAYGFDHFFGSSPARSAQSVSLFVGHAAATSAVPAAELTERFTAAAVRWIAQAGEQPFLLLLSHSSSHQVSPRFHGVSRASRYGDWLQSVDWSTGEILEALQKTGQMDNTLVIFTSDNGPYLGGNTGGLRGTKGTPWEGGYRVPFIAKWSAHLPAGTQHEFISMNFDLLPTLLDATGQEFSGLTGLHGKSLLPALHGEVGQIHDRLYLFSGERIAAVRTPRWKAVFLARYRGVDRWLPPHDVHLLFDMQVDDLERYSVAQNHPDQWQEMNRLLEWGQSNLLPDAAHETGPGGHRAAQ